MKRARRSTEWSAILDIDGTAHRVRIRPHPTARSVKLRYDGPTGEVRITVPVGMGDRAALRMASDHNEWLKREIARAVAPVDIRQGVMLAFEGHEREIRWSNGSPRRPRLEDGFIIVGGEETSLGPRLVRWLREEAREKFANDLTYYCARAGRSVPALAIGDPRTRWGSCSTRSGIRLNWRLIMAPVSVRRSVVAHEVAHLTHMNHGPHFYAHLDNLFEGDRAAADDWLRMNGNGLRAIGAARSFS